MTLAIAFLFTLIAIPYSMSKKYEDMINMSPFYFIAAVTGSWLFLQLMKNFKSRTAISWIGANSLLYLCCHQYFLFIAARGLHINNPFLVTSTALVLSGIATLLINRYCPVIIGKRKPITS